MRHSVRAAWILVLGGALSAGCYADRVKSSPPPADVVVPPRPSPGRSDLPLVGHREAAAKAEETRKAREGDLVEEFRDAYLRAGRPRLLILVNEVLEREFVDYRSGRRWIWEDRVKGLLAEEGGARRMEMERRARMRVERPTSRPRRLMPAEWGVARAREIFFDPFRRAGTRLVDPDAAVRAYAHELAAGAAEESTRKVEFDAWRKFADVMVELLFVPDFRTRTWRVAAKAVDLASARDLSYVTSYDEKAAGAVRVPGAPPSVALGERDTGLRRTLRAALKLMEQMAQAWEGGSPETPRASRSPERSPSTGNGKPPSQAGAEGAKKKGSGQESEALFEEYVERYLREYRARTGS